MAAALTVHSCVALTFLGLLLLGIGAEAGGKTITITDVGGDGCYPEVTQMDPGENLDCKAGAAACHQTAVFRNASLAPFDEELTMVFHGPIEFENIAVYYPTGNNPASTTWARESYWSPSSTENLVWLNNQGGGVSGSWSICGGNSQSYASANGSLPAASAQQFTGSLDENGEVNILAGKQCSGTECGPFFRPVSYHGWDGPQGAKAFVLRLSMPQVGTKSPAFWILNAKIVHTAQYGCNCRGTGPKGCGELDVLEVLVGQDQTVATSTIYSFRGAIGVGAPDAFDRPTTPTTYAVVFDPTQGVGRIQLTIIDDSFDFPASIAKSVVDEWNSHVGHTMTMANRIPEPNPYPCPPGGGGDGGGGSGNGSPSAASRPSSFLF